MPKCDRCGFEGDSSQVRFSPNSIPDWKNKNICKNCYNELIDDKTWKEGNKNMSFFDSGTKIILLVIAVALIIIAGVFVVSIGSDEGALDSVLDSSGNGTTISQNDDVEFIRQAKTIVNSLNPVSCYGLSYDSSKTMTYKLKLNGYEISEECETIRDLILSALDDIDDAYAAYLKYETLRCNSLTVKSNVNTANNNLESAEMLLLIYD